MHIKMINEIMDYTQNLGSSEDIVTGLLATSLANCPTFMNRLLDKLGIKNIQKEEDGADYCLDTGFVINSEGYRWIQDAEKSLNKKGLNFRPDIMISKSEEWNDDIPKKEKLILIESKIWAKLEDHQGNSYKSFKKVCNNVKIKNVCTVLISLDEIGNSKILDNFDVRTTWNQVIGSAREIIRSHENLAEKLFLEEIFDLIEMRLIPSKDYFLNDGNVCCNNVLQSIKYRIASYSSERVRKAKAINSFTADSEYGVLAKKNGINNDCQMSYLSIQTKAGIVEIYCAFSTNGRLVFWHEMLDKNNVKYNEPKIISEMDLTKPYWKQSWYETLYKISDVISEANKRY